MRPHRHHFQGPQPQVDVVPMQSAGPLRTAAFGRNQKLHDGRAAGTLLRSAHDPKRT